MNYLSSRSDEIDDPNLSPDCEARRHSRETSSAGICCWLAVADGVHSDLLLQAFGSSWKWSSINKSGLQDVSIQSTETLPPWELGSRSPAYPEDDKHSFIRTAIRVGELRYVILWRLFSPRWISFFQNWNRIFAVNGCLVFRSIQHLFITRRNYGRDKVYRKVIYFAVHVHHAESILNRYDQRSLMNAANENSKACGIPVSLSSAILETHVRNRKLSMISAGCVCDRQVLESPDLHVRSSHDRLRCCRLTEHTSPDADISTIVYTARPAALDY